MVSECAKETTTQHYLGAGNGLGPVRSDEVVLFAVFENVPHDGGRLTPLAFQSKQLRRGEVSLARLAHTTRAIFDERVIQALEHRFGKCLGITRANVAALRAIQFEVSGAIPTIRGRAVCVLDKVGQEDYDGHAALEYSETEEGLTQKQKERYRPLIHAELADTFGEILSLDRGFGGPVV